MALIQALLFVMFGALGGGLKFRPQRNVRTVLSLAMIAFALVLYPLLGFFLGHRYPALPTFGTPCPTTIFTIGILFMLVRPFSRMVFLIPILWSAIGGSAALLLGIPEDVGLIAAGAMATVFVLLDLWQHGARAGPGESPVVEAVGAVTSDNREGGM
jgi:hypothetical protein